MIAGIRNTKFPAAPKWSGRGKLRAVHSGDRPALDLAETSPATTLFCCCCLLCGLFPTLSTLHSTLPVCVQFLALLLAHLGLKGAVDGPLLRDFLGAFPETYGQTCQVCSTERSRLGHLGPL